MQQEMHWDKCNGLNTDILFEVQMSMNYGRLNANIEGTFCPRLLIKQKIATLAPAWDCILGSPNYFLDKLLNLEG